MKDKLVNSIKIIPVLVPLLLAACGTGSNSGNNPQPSHTETLSFSSQSSPEYANITSMQSPSGFIEVIATQSPNIMFNMQAINSISSFTILSIDGSDGITIDEDHSTCHTGDKLYTDDKCRIYYIIHRNNKATMDQQTIDITTSEGHYQKTIQTKFVNKCDQNLVTINTNSPEIFTSLNKTTTLNINPSDLNSPSVLIERSFYDDYISSTNLTKDLPRKLVQPLINGKRSKDWYYKISKLDNLNANSGLTIFWLQGMLDKLPNSTYAAELKQPSKKPVFIVEGSNSKTSMGHTIQSSI